MNRVFRRDHHPSPLPFLLLLAACGGQGSTPKATAPQSTTPAITAADLRTRLYAFADDSMQGRQSGTAGNVKGTDWIAAEAKRIGLEPAGEDGGWFQTVPVLRRPLDTATALTVEGQTFKAWTDLIPRDQGTGARPVDGARAIYAGTWGGTLITPEQAADKLVVVTFPPEKGVPAGSVNRAQTTQRFSTAAGIVVATLDGVAPSDRIDLEDAGAQLAHGSSGSSGSSSHAAPETPTFLYGSTRFAEALMGGPLAGMQPGTEGRTVSGTVRFVATPTEYPARNVVAILRGSNPKLRGQMVAIGAHNDHDGIFPEALDHDSLRAFNRVMRPEGANSTPGKPTAEQSALIRAILDSLRKEHEPRRDSVLNGADDDGSGSVAVLEIAEALVNGQVQPKRSILFVWHTAEEMGLLGSDYYTRHPTVPRDSIVAQLNVDMIGRGSATDRPGGGPGYVQMIGSRRLSAELGDLIDSVNADVRHGLQFDYTYDADGHPDNYYCRSDHYMYARFGIPIAFFTTGSHQDYHQLTDEPQYIDYEKMARVTSLIADVAMTVADLDHRVVVDKPKPDPEGVCKQ
ncbi:MAG TPA: M28 family peptidase [Gemmatimonadales bacterium]|nr:M28 family peptidase [Gemmatimonadales bacterium]